MEANLPGTRANLDTEFLHDLRVATRRTRSLLGQLPKVFPEDDTARFKAGLAWLQQTTGPVRDLDVYLLDFDSYLASLPPRLRPHLEHLRSFLLSHYAEEQRRLADTLGSDRFADLMRDWRAFLEAPVPDHPGPVNAARPVKAVADARIWRLVKRVRREGRAIRAESPSQDLHELRKTCKKLRYLMEFFQSLYPEAEIRALVRVLKLLLDTLGGYQDLAVQAAHLRELAQRMRDEGQADTDTLLAIGALIGNLLSPPAGAADGLRRGLRRIPEGGAPPSLPRTLRRRGGRWAANLKIVAVYSIKGGVGKTATAVNLAYLSAYQGSRTLVWDLDPQGAASFYFRIKPKVEGGGKALVKGRNPLDEAIKGTDFERLDLLPSDFSYRHMDLLLTDAKVPTKQLQRLLRPLAQDYDTVFLDCPPSITLVSENVFRAADALLVPIIPTTLSDRTLHQLLKFLEHHGHGPSLRVLPFFSMVDRRRRLHLELMERLPAQYPGFLKASIPDCAEVERMGVYRMPLPAQAPSGQPAAAYRALWSEVCQALAAPATPPDPL